MFQTLKNRSLEESKGKCGKCMKWFYYNDRRVERENQLFHPECIDHEKFETSLPDVKMEPVPPIADFWGCNVCKFGQNDHQLQMCNRCGFPKGTPNEDSTNIPNEQRWRCNLCLESGNHPLSLQCLFCGSDKDVAPLEPPEATNLSATNENNELPVSQLSNDPQNFLWNNEADFVVQDETEYVIARKNSPVELISSSSSANADVSQQLPQPCSICDCNINDDTRFISFRPVCLSCQCYCSSCYATWITSQITAGKGSELKCPCLQTTITYRQVSNLSYLLPPDILERYHQAMRTKVTSSNEYRINCPDCNYPQDVKTGDQFYCCGNPLCGNFNCQLCCKHQIPYIRLPPRNERMCEKCVEEHGSDPIVYELLQKIINEVLEYRCPSCKNVVGLPEDLVNNCLALACSHCPLSFCGFCYQYSGIWNNTHFHVRACDLNPRRNYFVESPEIWVAIQRKRKEEEAREIIRSHATKLSSMQIDNLWKQIELLL